MPDYLANNDIDLSFLNEIADGSDEFIVESIAMFLEQAPEMLQGISAAIDSKDWVSAAATAHKLKPTLGFFGMTNSQGLIQQVELMCKAGGSTPDTIVENFKQAKTIIDTNLIALTQLKEEKEAGL
jgi:HPt (histidine-containing phosphotransfer) domain-containing protein